MGLLDTIANWFNRESPPVQVPPRGLFRGRMECLASSFGAKLHWDDAGDAGMAIRVGGETLTVLAALRGGRTTVCIASNVTFPPGCLPGDVAAFLADRNKTLPFADWDAVDNGRRAYFVIKASGRMEEIDFSTLRGAVERMLAECVALDCTLREQGYAR